ncbi:hypothetical protein [Nocardia shimofusensis]|uniref:hypothetical protein n=1 Tax=Nocardia shimofusensis TaxID=228596 RepID=UPI000AB94AB9|nr:hypothetical protein [Nocardia shimofusensis]
MTAAGIARARAVADAVLYEGYLLYPYRANSRKNRSRWQFGVLGPPGAAAAGLGEEPSLSAEFVLEPGTDPVLTWTIRFLQLQHRQVIDGAGTPRAELTVGGRSWLSWDEAVAREIVVGPVAPGNLVRALTVSSGSDTEEIAGAADEAVGALVRTRQPLAGEFELGVERDGRFLRLAAEIRNVAAPATDSDDALARSLIGAHLIVEAAGGQFVSALEPPADAAVAVERCDRHRCFPVLAGPPGDRTLLLISPIILYDHPEIAEQSEGALFDSTEIDEILTLRVMTMTDDEKAQARATDARAGEIIDRCDAVTPETMRQLHGVLRDPHPGRSPLVPEVPEGIDWWDPAADGAVRPDIDAVPVSGVLVRRGSRVRLHPSRRADAQDLFTAGRSARVVSVHEDVDGQAHVGVVLDDDPAADLHEWFGRYLYFAPDELEPLDSPRELEGDTMQDHSEEPQEARGQPGSRDTGADTAAAGSTDREPGDLGHEETTSVHGTAAEREAEFVSEPVPGSEPPVPPYDDRKKTANDADETATGTVDDVDVGGATSPTEGQG